VNAQATRFLDVYTVELRADMEKDPAGYCLPFDGEAIRRSAVSTAARMVQHMVDGITVNVSNAMRRAAKKLGVGSRVRDIHAYCRGEGTQL